MAVPTIEFDAEPYQIINQAREVWLRRVIAALPIRQDLSTALDLGCGAGYFSGVLRDLGFSVTGLDLRADNIDICRSRYPNVKFGLIDLDGEIGDMGIYDLVLLFGVLYHLQSPLQTILRIRRAIGRVGIVSTRVVSGNEMACYLFSEPQGAAHNTARVTCVPTFPAVISIFSLAGFDHIYYPEEQPDHPQWHPDFGNGRRHCFVVAREPLDVPRWELLTPLRFLRKWEPIVS